MNWLGWRQWLATRLHVPLVHQQTVYARAIERTLQPGDRWLDIGCGRRILPDWACSAERQHRMIQRSSFVCGIDLGDGMKDNRQIPAKVYAHAAHLPFADATFDFVTANMVVEHLSDPLEVLAQVHRVLRPGGRFVIHTPNRRYYLIFLATLVPDAVRRRIVHILEQRDDQDIFPTFYRCNLPKQFESYARLAGFNMDALTPTLPFGSFLRLGPLAVLEVLLIKIHTWRILRTAGESFVVVLSRPPASRPSKDSCWQAVNSTSEAMV